MKKETMKEITLNGSRLLLVEVPEEAHDFSVHNLMQALLFQYGPINFVSERLIPKGNWQLLFKDPLNPTEEEAAGVVEKVSGWSSVIYYDYMANGRDYRDIVEAAFNNAVDSWNSFVTSHGFEIGKTVALIKK